MGWSQTTVIAIGGGPHRLDSKFFKFLIFLNFNALWGGGRNRGVFRFLLLLRILGKPRILESVFCNWRCWKSETANCATTRPCMDNTMTTVYIHQGPRRHITQKKTTSNTKNSLNTQIAKRLTIPTPSHTPFKTPVLYKIHIILKEGQWSTDKNEKNFQLWKNLKKKTKRGFHGHFLFLREKER